jgi:hemoglobin-like flavoprotein
MTITPAFRRAATIEASLELLAKRCEDPTRLVYATLFSRHPEVEVHFFRDTNGAIRGEMLARTLEAILDFIGERRYSARMFQTELITHEGYDIPRSIFSTFFTVIRDTMKERLKEEWSFEFERAWSELLPEIEAQLEAVALV